MVLDKDYAAGHVGVVPGPYVMLAVTDTGSGMDEATRTRIFEPFFTTKDVGRGTGLGLATLYATVQRAGGNVWVYSEVGQGTTFKLYLPRAAQSDVRRLTSRPPMPAATLSGTETILVVEDDDLLRAAARRMLLRGGYQVLDAASGGDALIVAEQHDGLIELLWTDVVMPHLGGKDVARRLAVSRPEMRVLYMSGYTDEAIVHHGVLDENVAIVQKPFTPQQLLESVRAVLDSD